MFLVGSHFELNYHCDKSLVSLLLYLQVGNWVNLLSLFHLCPIEDFQSFCDEQAQLSEFVGELISVFQRAVREPFFPDEWIVMHLVQNRSVGGWCVQCFT